MSGPIWLQRPNASVPWGFRLKGGRDFQEPLTVQRVTVGSVAATGLSIGDVIMSIGETDTASLTNGQAQELIKSGGNLLQLYVRKSGGDAPSGQHQQQQVGRPAVQGALHELFDDIFKESDAMFSSLEADQQKQQARAAHAGSYGTSPNYASAGRQRPPPVEVVRGGPCNGYSPSQYQSPGRLQNDCTSPSSEGTGVGSFNNSYPRYGSQPISRQQSYNSPEVTSYNHTPPARSFSVQPTNHTEYFSATPSQWSPSSPPPPPPPNTHPLSPLFIPASPTMPATPAPPPPPPPPSNSSGATWRAEPPSPINEQFPTRLARQLSDLSTNSYPSPPPSNPTTPQQQTGPPDFGSCYGHRPTPIRRTPVQSPDQGVMPDAVLNMAARGGSDKKPFSYVPNTDMLQEQRNRVRRKPASAAVLPHYQSMLGTFDDSPLPNNIPSPMTSPGQAMPEPASEGETVVSHVQYNTPIGLYSNDNVMEAFEGQTGGLVTGVDGVPGKPKADITQSAVYQMIHGGDNQSRGRQRIPPPVRSKPTVSRDPTGSDEMRFSGLPSERAIPSKSFSMLQNMTSPSEVDTTSIMRPIGADDVDEVSGYDETSIRYRGCNIPSKSFRMLQNMTGSTGEVPAGVRQRPRKTPERILEEQNESQGNTDDIVDISYVGSNIPSRSFRFLQKSVGDDVAAPQSSDAGGGRNIKVVHLRTKQEPHDSDGAITDF